MPRLGPKLRVAEMLGGAGHGHHRVVAAGQGAIAAESRWWAGSTQENTTDEAQGGKRGVTHAPVATWRRPALSSGRETARGQGSRAERRQRLLDSPESKLDSLTLLSQSLTQESQTSPRDHAHRPAPHVRGAQAVWPARRTTPSSRAELGLATVAERLCLAAGLLR